MHERQVIHRVLADAHNHNLAASPHRERSGTNARLDTRALDDAWRGRVLVTNLALAAPGAEQRADGPGVAAGVEGPVDLVGGARRNEFPGKLETLRLEVGDEDGVGARGAGGDQGAEADWASAAYQDAAAEGQVGDAQGGEDDAQGLEKGALSEV